MQAQFDRVIYDDDRDAVVAVEDAVSEGRACRASPSSTTATRSSTGGAGTSELLGLLAAIIVLLFVFRTFVAM